MLLALLPFRSSGHICLGVTSYGNETILTGMAIRGYLYTFAATPYRTEYSRSLKLSLITSCYNMLAYRLFFLPAELVTVTRGYCM